MAKWVKPIEPDDVIDGNVYYIAKRPATRLSGWAFYAEMKNGKRQFCSKPGIALQYDGGEALRETLRKHLLVAVEVPKNAAKRWKAR